MLGAVGLLYRKKDIDCDRRQHEDRTEDDHPHEGSVSVHLTTFGQHHSFRPYDSRLVLWYFGLPNF